MGDVNPVSSTNSNQANWSTVNNAIRQLNNQNRVKVFNQSDGTNGLVQGILPNDEGYGDILYDSSGNARIVMRIINDVPEFKVSKTGFDVLSATNDQLLFNSAQDTFKIVSTGNATIPGFTLTDAGVGLWSSNSVVGTVAHGLSYIPIVLAYVAVAGAYYSLPYSISNAISTTSSYSEQIIIYADATNIFLSHYATGFHYGNTFASLPVKYYVLQETAS